MFLTQKNGKGVFYLVETLNGKKVWRSTHTREREKAEAILHEIETARGLLKVNQQKQIRDLIVERALAVSEALVSRKTSYQDAWNAYLSDTKTRDMKPFSVERVQSCWKAFVSYMQSHGVLHIEQVDFDRAGVYLQYLSTERRLSAGTVLLHKTNLQGVFQRVKRPLGLSGNPFDDQYTPLVKRKTHRCFTDSEIRSIFDCLLERSEIDWLDLCLLSLYTGLRFGDCCSVKAEDISEDGGILTNANRKLERYERKVTIPLAVELKTRLGIRKMKHTSGYLFPEFFRNYNTRNRGFLEFFPELLQELQITETSDGIVGFHSFRHTFNTRLVENGTDLGVRMKLVGHSNINTNQLYNHALTAAKTAIETLQFPSLVV